MFNHTLSAILRGGWLISEDHASSYLPLITSLITRGSVGDKLNGNETLTGEAEFESPYIINAVGKRINVYEYNRETRQFGINLEKLTPGFIGVVPFIGPVMKYDGGCGEPGLVKRTGWGSDLANHPNCIGLISWIDSPGGQADGTPQYTDFIKSLSIPTVAFISGGAYSAGAWVASGHDKIFCADKHCGFGSIGAYTTMANFDGFYEKQGVKVKTVYPDVSKDKNKGYRDIFEKNDDTLVREDITQLALSFIESFAENRQGKLKNDSWNTGKVFSAKQAKEIGLIDEITSFQNVVASLQQQKISPKTTQSTQNNNMNLKNVQALAGVENPTAEQIELANADLSTAGVIHATLVPESFITEAESVTAQNKVLTQQLADANTALATAQADLATANTTVETHNATVAEMQGKLDAHATTITGLEAKVEAFGANAGAFHTNTAGNDAQIDVEENDIEATLANMPHNKMADSL